MLVWQVTDPLTGRVATASADPSTPDAPAHYRVSRAVIDDAGVFVRDQDGRLQLTPDPDAEAWVRAHAPADGTPGQIVYIDELEVAHVADLNHPHTDPLGVLTALWAIGSLPDSVGAQIDYGATSPEVLEALGFERAAA